MFSNDVTAAMLEELNKETTGVMMEESNILLGLGHFRVAVFLGFEGSLGAQLLKGK